MSLYTEMVESGQAAAHEAVTVEQLAADHELRTIVLTGAGDAFSAGGDLEMMEQATRQIEGPEGSPPGSGSPSR